MKGFLYGLITGLALSAVGVLASDLMLPTDPGGLDDYLLQRQYQQQQQEIEALRNMDRNYSYQGRRSPC